MSLNIKVFKLIVTKSKAKCGNCSAECLNMNSKIQKSVEINKKYENNINKY